MNAVLLGLAALAATYAVMRFDGTVLPRRPRHGYVAGVIAVVAIGLVVGFAVLSLALSLGVLVLASAYAKVVLAHDRSERRPTAQERRRGYLALGIALGALITIVAMWGKLR